MGRSRYAITEPDAPHFMTCTIVHWTPVFTRPETVQIILDSLKHLQEKHQLRLYGYVILENHLHCIGQAPDLGHELNRFKAYTAKQLLQFFESRRVARVLEALSRGRRAHKTDRAHQVWEEGSHPQMIENAVVLRQKLAYIHMNPVKRGYVDVPEHWRYSSARNYAGLPGLIEVYQDWS